MKTRASLTTALLSSALLSACVSVFPDPKPADVVYRLTSPGVSVPADAGAIIFRVDRPSAPQALNGDDIIVAPTSRELVTANGARWAEAVPTLVQKSIINEIGQRSSIIGVEPTAGARADLRIHINIRNFEAIFDNGQDSPPEAVAHYMVTVSDAATRKLISTHDVRKAKRASAVRISSIVEAQDAAHQMAIEDIADWLETLTKSS